MKTLVANPRLTYPRNDNVLKVLADFVKCLSQFFALRIPIGPEKNDHQLVSLSVPQLLELVHGVKFD